MIGVRVHSERVTFIFIATHPILINLLGFDGHSSPGYNVEKMKVSTGIK